MNELSVDESYLSHWLALAEKIPRHSFFLTEENEFAHALEMELKTFVASTTVISSEMDLKEAIQPYNDNSVSVDVNE